MPNETGKPRAERFPADRKKKVMSCLLCLDAQFSVPA